MTPSDATAVELSTMSTMSTKQVAEASDVSADGARTRRGIEFTGNGGAYFRIWAVGAALTLLTLGAYSAWAKVRARRYLYGNVWLDGANFDYTASPLALLRGRAIVAVVLVVLWVANLLSPLFYGLPVYYWLALLALSPLLPWVVVRARSYNLRNSRTRNIAFGFDGGYRDAALWYPVAIAVAILTFGLALPYMSFGRDRYLVSNSRFGEARMRLVDARAGDYYGIYLGAVGIAILASIVMIVVIRVIVAAGGSSPLLGIAVGAMPLLAPMLFVRVKRANYRWSHTRLHMGGEEGSELRFELTLSFGAMLWIYLTNALLIAATAGLYAPFAKMRAIRYRLSEFRVIGPSAAVFMANAEPDIGATGAEAGEAFGFEVAL